MLRRFVWVLFTICLLTITNVAWAADGVDPKQIEATHALSDLGLQISSIYRQYNGEYVLDGDLKTGTQRWISSSKDTEPTCA